MVEEILTISNLIFPQTYVRISRMYTGIYTGTYIFIYIYSKRVCCFLQNIKADLDYLSVESYYI